jgi:Ca2+-binding RTX toxin-like protein
VDGITANEPSRREAARPSSHTRGEQQMAHIKGTILMYTDWFDDDLHGKPEDDTIEGLGGNDNIWGEAGDDDMYGGDGDDWIWPTESGVIGAWGEDSADGGNGDDHLLFGVTTDDVELWGGGGGDWIAGGSGNDILYGDNPPYPTKPDYPYPQPPEIYTPPGVDIVNGNDGNDKIVGGLGSDILDGGDDDDYLYGGDINKLSGSPYDHDTLMGGAGNDVIDAANRSDMTGGLGHDRFIVDEVLDKLHGGPNHITDFQAGQNRWIGAWDTIGVAGPDGTASNYDEATSYVGAGYDAAKDFAENWFTADSYVGGDLRYLFITDKWDGYFFADTNSDGTMDAAVVLDGLNQLSDFNYNNVVNDFASNYYF